MAANTKQRKGFKQRKARNRKMLDESRNREINKRNNMIKMIQDQMIAADKKKESTDGETAIGPTEQPSMGIIQDEETKALSQ